MLPHQTSARESPTVNLPTPIGHTHARARSKQKATGGQPGFVRFAATAEGRHGEADDRKRKQILIRLLCFTGAFADDYYIWRCDCGRRIQGESTGWSNSCLCVGLPLIQWHSNSIAPARKNRTVYLLARSAWMNGGWRARFCWLCGGTR